MVSQNANETPTDLAAAIQRALRPDSYYWLFLHEPDHPELDHEIETRIDIPPDVSFGLEEFPGWHLAASKPERVMMFLRRFQPLTREAVGALIVEATTMAYRFRGKFHSWTHDR